MDPALRRELHVEVAERVSGGCIHRCYRVTIDGQRFFLKTNDARHADAFAAEADGLHALRKAGLRAPEPQSHGVASGHAFLLLEYLELETGGDFAALGAMLAAAHRRPAPPRFGWQRDNYIGSTPQANGWCDDWDEFWRERRIRPQIEMARRKGFDIDDVPVEKLLAGHEPRTALLHGDLWSGNAGFISEGPVVFDPAVYYGDREADLAMTELFGGFPREFYAAYEEAYPLAPGYQSHKPLYNLYHLLNHLNLFGGGYLGEVNSTLQRLRRGLKE